jgi:Zn-dependent protease with chaperone function
MPLYWFLLLISALASDSLPIREVPAGRAVAASAGLMIGWAMLARLAVRTASRQILDDRNSCSATTRLFGRQMDFLRWLGLSLSVLALVGFGLATLVDRLPWGSESFTIRALLLLIPGLSATVWSWYCELRFDQAVYPLRTSDSLFGFLVSMFRLQAAWLIAPVLVLLGLIDLTQWLLDVPPAQGAIISGVVALSALPLLLPTILSRIWKLRSLESCDHSGWVDQVVRATGTRGIGVMMWDTDGAYCTAMVAGFIPGFRRLLLSDALLWRLSPQQASMVVLHELAHVRRFHLPLRLMVLIPVWGVSTWVTHILENFAYAEVTGILLGLALSLIALRVVAYRTELDADAIAVRMATEIGGSVAEVPATAPLASAALADALMIVTADHPSARKATWMHPSIERRCRALLGPHALLEHTAIPTVLASHGHSESPKQAPAV